MYFHVQEFINEIAQDEPDPAALLTPISLQGVCF